MSSYCHAGIYISSETNICFSKQVSSIFCSCEFFVQRLRPLKITILKPIKPLNIFSISYFLNKSPHPSKTMGHLVAVVYLVRNSFLGLFNKSSFNKKIHIFSEIVLRSQSRPNVLLSLPFVNIKIH